jgi:DNA-binding GntR family transcriptional regulator
MTMDRVWRFATALTVTDSESAVVQLKKDILSGALAPNEKLRGKELIARNGIGASPMREALARLSGTGLVKLEGQKGFRVSPLAHNDLIDITRARQVIESEALALSIEQGDDEWEAEIVKAFHLFSRELDRRGEASDEWLNAFEACHHAFHSSLIAACPVQTLKCFCDDLYLRKERYRRVMFGYRFEKAEVFAEHETLMNHILSRNIAKARSALIAHIGLTADVLARLLPPHPPV